LLECVILSVAKDLKVLLMIDALTNREILHFVQNDKESKESC